MDVGPPLARAAHQGLNIDALMLASLPLMPLLMGPDDSAAVCAAGDDDTNAVQA